MKNPALNTGRDLVSALGSLKGRSHVSDDYVDLRACIYSEQFRVLTSLSGNGHGVARKTSGPLSAGDLKADAGIIKSLASSISGSLSGIGKPQSFLSALLREAEKRPVILTNLVKAAAFGPDQSKLSLISSEIGEPVESALFYGRVLAAPFVTAVAETLPGAGSEDRTKPGGCPRCGSDPGLSSLAGEEGKRSLHCSLCASIREYDRSQCAFCGERSALGKFTETKDDEMWLEVCDKCRNYIKVVDGRKVGPVIPLVHVTAGLYLDMLAGKKGYKRALPYAAAG